jgi:predicted DNA-binding transcriptional regulator AlpA
VGLCAPSRGVDWVPEAEAQPTRLNAGLEVQDRLVRLPELVARLGRSESSIRRDLCRDPRFPRPIHVGRSVAWIESEIEAFIRGLADQRDATRGKQRWTAVG